MNIIKIKDEREKVFQKKLVNDPTYYVRDDFKTIK